MSGLPRTHLAALDSATGAPLAGFDAHLTLDDGVGGLVSVGSRLYLDIRTYHPTGGVTYTRAVRALNAADGTQVTAFAPVCEYPRVIAATADVVYVAGCASGPEGLDALRAADGAPLPGFAAVGGVTGPVALAGSQLFVSGTVNSATAVNVAHYLEQVDATTGAVKRSFITDRAPDAVAAGPGELVAGGTAVSGGAVPRQNLAAFDVADGSPIGAFAPQVDGVVYAVAIAAGNVYFSGAFTHVNGVPRAGLAAVRLSDGVLVASFAPASVGYVASIVASASTLYVGGLFDQAGGQPRHNLAALNLTDGTATGFDARLPGFVVSALQLAGSTLYVGSSGSSSPGLSALDAVTGATLPAFQPTLNGSNVDRMAVGGNTLYITGDFQTRRRSATASLAAVDATDGSIPTTSTPRAASGPSGRSPRPRRRCISAASLRTTQSHAASASSADRSPDRIRPPTDSEPHSSRRSRSPARHRRHPLRDRRFPDQRARPDLRHRGVPPALASARASREHDTPTGTGHSRRRTDADLHNRNMARLRRPVHLRLAGRRPAKRESDALRRADVRRPREHVRRRRAPGRTRGVLRGDRRNGGEDDAASAPVTITTAPATPVPVPAPTPPQIPPTTPDAAPPPPTIRTSHPPAPQREAGPSAPTTRCLQSALDHRALTVALSALAPDLAAGRMPHAHSIHLRGRVLRQRTTQPAPAPRTTHRGRDRNPEPRRG